KHHRNYIDTTNQLVAERKVQAASLEEVVKSSDGRLFNNAAQAWNHGFYWRSLTPEAGKPSTAFMKRLQGDLGGWDRFARVYADAAIGQFGSGWAWLVVKHGRLEIMATSNAETPMARDITCLLALDVWEHAYYADYRNRRDSYVEAVIND